MRGAICGLLVVLAAVVLAGSALGQSVFFDEGQGGFGFAASYSHNEDVNGFTGSMGASINGKVDLQLAIGQFDGSYSASVTAAGFGLGYYPFAGRPEPSSAGVGFELGYENYSGSGTYARSVGDNAYSAGTIVYAKFTNPNNTSFIPFVGFRYVTHFDDDYDSKGVIDAGLTISGRASKNCLFMVTPRMQGDGDYFTISIEVGAAIQSRPFAKR